ncbi:MAG TPA: chloride channel protein [Candidatus Polarisedimenticolia bacterium]|jgi:CIC family chloride channel protein|nr:chloride channel protein [Candidatus Polarisedimenticolia bacterium]
MEERRLTRLRMFADWRPFVSLLHRPPGEKRFLLLVPLTGVVTGLASVALIRLLGLFQGLFWGSRHEILEHALALPLWHRFLVPTLGGAMIGLIVFMTREPVGGHGTTALIEAVAQRGGVLHLGRSLLKAAATIITVGTGGSLGREGPLIRVGAALGSVLGRRFHLAGNRLNILLGCGAAAGIAAAYNAPIGGALFALEVILGNFALESFGPIVVAAAIGTVISRHLISAYPAYHPPDYSTLTSGWELWHYLLMGILIGVASSLFILALRGAEKGFKRLPLPEWAKPVAGFALLGLIGAFVPHVFGNGYDTTNHVLLDDGVVPLSLVIVLPLLKLAATALTAGSGGSGGLFTPTLFIGSTLGYVYGAWCHESFPLATSVPGAYALVGMGAMIAGTTQVPLTSIMIIFELTGDYEVILPLMVACTGAVVVSRLLHRESIYTESLIERGVRLGGRMEELVMDTIQVRDLMRSACAPVNELESVGVVMKRLLEEGRKELFVVGEDGRLLGAITLGDLSEPLRNPEAAQTLRARDVMYTDVPVLREGDLLSVAIGRWKQVSRDRLPVVDSPESRRLVGELSAGDIIAVYSQEVLHKEARLARFDRRGPGERPQTTFVELPGEYVVAMVMLPESFPGMTLRELGARQRFGVNIIELKRALPGGRERRIMPDPNTELKPGDGLIVVGRPAEIARLGDPISLAEIAAAHQVPAPPDTSRPPGG